MTLPMLIGLNGPDNQQRMSRVNSSIVGRSFDYRTASLSDPVVVES